MSEIKFKPITHKERKDYVKKIKELDKLEDEKRYDALMEFRENFLKAHLPEETDLDSMETTEVDELFKNFEKRMDFQMGLRNLMNSNTVPSQENLQTPKQEK